MILTAGIIIGIGIVLFGIKVYQYINNLRRMNTHFYNYYAEKADSYTINYHLLGKN